MSNSMGYFDRLRTVVEQSKRDHVIMLYDSYNLVDKIKKEANTKWGIPVLKDKNNNWLIVYTGDSPNGMLDRVFNKAYEYRNNTGSRDYWFRSTNNKSEPEILDNFRSKNFSDDVMEKGMSVSEHPYYHAFHNYKYIYVVTGDVIGNGSDGEPLLINVKALSKPAKELSKIWKNKYEKSLRTDIPSFGTGTVDREDFRSIEDFEKKYDLLDFEIYKVLED